ncbi:MAG: hypothetical protein Q4A62_04750 [Eikenella sp.]|nr:hypothetical protein [Eikenella sp.]
MPDSTPPKPAKKRGLFGKLMFGLLLLTALVVAVLVFLAWQALNHPGTPAGGTASDPNNGSVEIWQPNGAVAASQVYVPVTGKVPPAASEAAVESTEADTAPARNERAGTAPAETPAAATPAAEMPIQPVNTQTANAAETEIQPVNTPPARQQQRPAPRRQQDNPENPVDNLF